MPRSSLLSAPRQARSSPSTSRALRSIYLSRAHLLRRAKGKTVSSCLSTPDRNDAGVTLPYAATGPVSRGSHEGGGTPRQTPNREQSKIDRIDCQVLAEVG